MDQKPSLGRVVIFNSPTTKDGQPAIEKQAAFVIGVHSETTVSVVAWNEYGTSGSHRSLSQGDGANQWNWPPRV